MKHRHTHDVGFTFAILFAVTLAVSAQSPSANLPATVFPPYLQHPAADGMTVCFLAQAAERVRVAWGADDAASLTETAVTPLVIPGTPWGEDQWPFTMRAGPVWFLGMDTGEDGDGTSKDPRTAYKHPAFWETYRQREAEWLEEVIDRKAGADAPWRIFLSHIPLYNNTPWYCASGKRLWEPLLRTTRIDLMLAGHDHRNGGDCAASRRLKYRAGVN